MGQGGQGRCCSVCLQNSLSSAIITLATFIWTGMVWQLSGKCKSDHAKGKEILPSKVSSSGGTWMEFPCGGFGLMRPCPVRGWNEEPMMTNGPWLQVRASSGEAVSTLGRAQKALEDLDLPILYLFRTKDTYGVYESIL